MSIADKLTKLNTDITNAYSSISAKGGTIPTNKNTENLASAIESISGGSGSGLSAIYVETAGKTKYNLGEIFTLDGYVIKAIYTNEAQKDVTSSCTFTPNGELTENDTSITISYTEDGVTKTVEQTITVIVYEQLINYTMIYDYGDECTDITGGWDDSYKRYNTNKGGAITKNTNNFKTVKTKSYTNSLIAKNTISLNNYNKIFGYGITTNIKIGFLHFVYPNPGTTSSCDWTNEIMPTVINENEMVLGDISNTLETYYALIFSAGGQECSTGDTATLYACGLLKADDWTTLAEKAGITASSIDDILTNSTILLSNEDAVNFMLKQCTGDFMASAVKSETFLTALNNSTYKTIIHANEHWNKFLNMVA